MHIEHGELTDRVVLEHRLVMRCFEQTDVHRLWYGTGFREPHLRAVFHAVVTAYWHLSAIRGHEHGQQLCSVGAPAQRRYERGEQRRATDLRAETGGGVGHKGV